VTLLDAYAIIALLRGEPGADAVERLFGRPDDGPAISAANVAEVVDVLVRHHRRAYADVVERLDWLTVGGLDVLPVTDEIARRAGALHAGHYHRVRSPLSLADCVCLATAMDRDESLATADGPLLEAARAEGCPTVAL